MPFYKGVLRAFLSFSGIFIALGRADTFGKHCLTRIKKVSGPGGFPEKPPGRARRREIPQPPDLINKDRSKITNHRLPSGILNQKALVHCLLGFATL